MIDVSEHLRFIDKNSFLGVATSNGSFKKNVYLTPATKRRINKYSNKVDKIHCVLAYHLIKTDLHRFDSIQFCNDISKIKLLNNLRKLFRGNHNWIRLEQQHKVKILSTKNSFVDNYVKKVRTGIEQKGEELKIEQLKEYLNLFN